MFPSFTEFNLETQTSRVQQPTMENPSDITHHPESSWFEIDDEYDLDDYCFYEPELY